MLEVSVSGFPPESKQSENAQPCVDITRRYHLDAHPGLVFSVPLHGETCVVEITLIDWASIVEINSFQTDEVYTLSH
jgi:hypothetical protein